MKRYASSLTWTALVLVLLGVIHSWWRVEVHDVSLFPGSQYEYWDVEARVELQAHGQPVKVTLTLPQTQPGYVLQAEHTASPGYGVNIESDQGRRVIWTTRQAQGEQWLYYRVQFRVDPQRHPPPLGVVPAINEVRWSEPLSVAASQLLHQAWQASADTFSLANNLTHLLADANNQNAQMLLSEMSAAEAMVRLLNEAEIPARLLSGLRLEDGRRRQSLQPLVQVFATDHTWRLFSVSPAQGAPQDYLLWQQTAGPILEVEGGSDSRVSFSMLSTREPASSGGHASVARDALMNLSIHSLPIAEQAVFKTLLLLPVGALVVVFFRVLIGLRTSGTFMPVLIALAFLEMSWLPGLITFLLIVSIGLVLRQLLAYLNLLLVARVAVVIVCVIGLMAFMAVISFHAGINTGMQVTLFPMIILAWTIERMSILWEEEGPKEVMIQGAGSLITASAAFVVMDHMLIRYWLFNFPGMQLIVMAMILLVGSYTGYRLLELWRFRPLVTASSSRSDDV